jgi:UDP-N-acetylglucosamine 2-epimerase
VIFPVHPRTRNKFKDLLSNAIKTLAVIEPVSYREMIAMTKDARCIITDSGGVQKEAFLLGSPCVTVRETTEWPETIEAGANRLVIADAKAIFDTTLTMMNMRISKADNPFGDGTASYKIARFINEHCL